MGDRDEEIKANVRLAAETSEWLRRAGVPDASVPELAVGLSDIIYAVRACERELRAMLEADPADRDGADRAQDHLASLEVRLLNEVSWHLDDLRKHWPKLEDALEARLAGGPAG